MGSGHLNRGGYRIISIRGRRKLEHRHVMERILGRRLWPFETVHHKNGRRADNGASNLELWASSHPSGQRVADLVGWAVALLSLYAPEKLTDGVAVADAGAQLSANYDEVDRSETDTEPASSAERAVV